jgi:hypothetical protein
VPLVPVMVIVYWPAGVLSPANPPLQLDMTSAATAIAPTLNTILASRAGGRLRNIAPIIGIMLITISSEPMTVVDHIGFGGKEGREGIGAGNCAETGAS